MSREKQIEEMAEAIEKARIKATDTTNSMNYGFGGWYAKELYAKGYRKASEVALETVDDFQRRLRHIFLAMCGGNDYNKVNLVQIDAAIEALYDTFVAELKKKYTCEKHRCHDCKHCTSVDESACEACIDGSRWESEGKE